MSTPKLRARPRASWLLAPIALVLVTTQLPAQGLTGFLFRGGAGAESDTVTVFADGNLRTSVGEDDATTLATGALGVEVKKRTVVMNLRIATTGTSQPLQENHAAAILVPGTGSSLNAGYGEIRVTASRPEAFFRAGLRSYVSVSTAEWADSRSSKTVGALVGGIGVGGFVNLFGGTITPPGGAPEAPAPAADSTAVDSAAVDSAAAEAAAVPVASEPGETKTRVAGVLDFGFAWRTLGGDVVNADNRDVLRNIFDSEAKNRLGLEIGVALQVNDLRAGLTYYLFGGSVPGLSRGQVVAGFSAAVPLMRGALN